MENKTAMQMLIQELDEMIKNEVIPDSLVTSEKRQKPYKFIKAKAIELRDTVEKEQIKDAVIFGNRQEDYDGTETIGEFYYNQKYNQ